MYLGKALQVTISGFDEQAVIDGAKQYCDENEGWMHWSSVYENKKWMGWFKWKTEYKIELYKPLDYKITRVNQVA